NYWDRKFARDPQIIGKSIYLAGMPVVVIGVTPAGFSGRRVAGNPAELVMPRFMQAQLESRSGLLKSQRTQMGLMNNSRLGIMARLKEGVTPDQAVADSNSIFQLLLAEAAQSETGERAQRTLAQKINLNPGARGDTELDQRATVKPVILMVVVGIILLIASVNVAILLLTRATVRQKEVAVRLAIGSSRGRLIRQLITESVLLALLGAALGLITIKWSVSLLLTTLSYEPNFISFDPRVDVR